MSSLESIIANIGNAQKKVEASAARLAADLFNNRRISARLPVAWAKDPGVLDMFNAIKLVRGLWVPFVPGVRVLLLDDQRVCDEESCGIKDLVPEACSCVCTRALMEGNGVVPEHAHPEHSEMITVIRGSYKDAAVYIGPGQRVTRKPGDVHSGHIAGMVMVCWQPPLQEFDFVRLTEDDKPA